MAQNSSSDGMVRDPVCGKDVVPGTARGWDYLFEEIVYHFCGSECRSRFGSNPSAILSAGSSGHEAAPVAPAPQETPSRSTLAAWITKWRAFFS